jgi:hypothetical protein
LFGESYTPEGIPQRVNTLVQGEDGKPRLPTPSETAEHDYAPFVLPLPRFEVTQPGNVLRVFEQGSRLGGVALGQNGAATPVVGIPDKNEDPGRPNNRLSDRGLGTLNRVDLPLLNVHKTRLNDPHLSFLGTNDQPGDYRSSGCTACHMVYANDRDPVHSGPYAGYGHDGEARMNADPTIAKNEPGHPIEHRLTTAIPSSQCMVCHMHQPNAFLNSFYGYQMWSYETDGEEMWPNETKKLSGDEWFERADRNPEGAARLGNWGDRGFLQKVADLNPRLKHTQFADYHGHGWIFRAVFKTDRKGNLLDKNDEPIPYDDPHKFDGVIPELGMAPDASHATHIADPQPHRAVHMKDIHAEKGMHCVDCHFEQDVHGDTHVYAEYQAAIEITCQDCHGTVEARAFQGQDGKPRDVLTSGPAAGEGHRLDTDSRTTESGQQQFEVRKQQLYQRSMIYPGVEWKVKQVKDTVTPGNEEFNPRAYYAKVEQHGAHGPDKMECHACHTSWTTSCFGCHLPQEADVRSRQRHFEPDMLRNLASYNPQVARDDVFMLGIEGDVKKNRVAPVRSSSAVMISSENAQREIIYKQQMPVAANGMSSQCFNTHFAHTVRKTETRKCDDCHVSSENDNNAWMAQVLLLGTNTTNFMGQHAFVGERAGLEAVKVTEWDEPEAVIGSNLHRLAYPERYRRHEQNQRLLDTAIRHGGDEVRSLQLRGEYLYAACGDGGFRVFDVANIANKGFSEPIVTSPVSPFGQNTHVATRYATAVALPTNNSISMSRSVRPLSRETGYSYRGRQQNLHESYRYAYVADREEGLILVDVDCLNDGDPRNNFLERALTWNPDHVLDGAENLAVCGTTVYVCCRRGIVALDIDDPLRPRVIAEVGPPAIEKPTSIAVQFRYAFVTDARGVQVLDVTLPNAMHAVDEARLAVEDARDVYVARTYAYVAAGKHGLVILDVERPEHPKIDRSFDAGGAIDDLFQVKVAMTNDSTYAYLADGRNGLRVISLVTPEDGGRSAYGFSPRPIPKLIATYPTVEAAIALSKGLDRDRAVDESGHQIAVFGRIGGRPFNLEEMRGLYLKNGAVYSVHEQRAEAPTSPVKATSNAAAVGSPR